jgi:hypothetical protein
MKAGAPALILAIKTKSASRNKEAICDDEELIS